MNKQIEKLALECGAWNQVYEPKLFMHDHNFDIERFARLIVRECGNYMNSRVPGNIEVSATVAKMKRHFGVEE